MKSTAALKSAASPLPPLNVPLLRPTPRKLNLSTAHPVRASAFAPWNTTFVCIVPPNWGCGCANTTAARIDSRPGGSRIASSGPAGPTRSEMAGMDEAAHPLGEVCRLCQDANVTRVWQHLVLGGPNQRRVSASVVDRHHPIESILAGQHEC